MSKKTYWNLLVLFGVLCQGIIGTYSEKDIDESSELLVRQKRVINRIRGGDVREQIKNVPYVVSIKAIRIHESCVGAILTNLIVLTVAKCVQLDTTRYRVYSGTARSTLTGRYVVHTVIQKRTLLEVHQYRPEDGIALLAVDPPFTYTINTHYVKLFDGHITPGTHGIVSGWGCNSDEERPGTVHPDYLRSIHVPIISNNVCQAMYLRNFAISERDICTLDATGQQYCCVDDAGAPLVIQMGYQKFLVGVHLWNGAVVGQSNPDVFVNLQFPTYKSFLVETINEMHQSHNHAPSPHYVQP